MYVRNKNNGSKGDLIAEYHDHVEVLLHSSQRRTVWKLGKGNVEFIAFGSFNPQSPNYVAGGRGKVVKVK